MTLARYSPLELHLGRALTEKVAPNELPFFDDIVADINSAPKTIRDNTLGFGVPGGDIGVTAVLLVICKPILTFIWENARDAAGQLIKDAAGGARSAIEARLSHWMDRKLQRPAPVHLPPDKLELFMNSVRQEAASVGLDQDTSARLMTTLRESFS